MSKDLLIRCGPPWAPWLVRPDAKTTIVALDKACQAFDLTVVNIDGQIHLTQATPCEDPPAPVALAQCLFGNDANFDITVDGRGYPGMTDAEALGEVENAVVLPNQPASEGQEIPSDREIPEAVAVTLEPETP